MNSALRRAGWAAIPLLAVVLWWVLRGGDPATHRTGSPPTAERSARDDVPAPAKIASREPAREPAPPTPAAVSGAAPTARPGDPGPPRATPGAAPSAPAASAPGPNLPTPPAAPAGSGDSASGGLTDKTGWADKSVGRQLNKELMPLVSECIDQAKARNPRLQGLLALSMSVAPTDNGKVIVAATPTGKNQVEDAELLECIRESSFSLEGLRAPHGFEVSIRVD